jgi:hypothetical protein
MKPSKELLRLAKEKAKATFKPNRSNAMRSIRLTADETSYTLFYQVGITYIGTYETGKLKKFFKNRAVYELRNDATGELTATMQRL